MFTTILVPLDGSLLAARALPYATHLARAGGSRLVLVRAHLPNSENLSLRVHHPEQTAAERTNLDRGLAQAELVATADRLRRTDLQVEARFVETSPAEAILETATSTGAGLIVMSSHGRSGMGRWLYGSVADRVLRNADVPVLVVSAATVHTWVAGEPASVLVPLDDSDLSRTILEPAAELATALQAELVLLSVLEPPIVVTAYGETTIPPDPEQDLARLRRSLDEAARELRPKTTQPVSIRVAYGDAPATINEVAREVHAVALAMATHGRGGLARLVMGSVATRTLQQATVPVLMSRPALVDAASVTSPAAPEAALASIS